MSCYAIIAAAGSGSRMGGRRVKTLQPLLGRPVICHSVDKLSACCDGVIVAARPEDMEEMQLAFDHEGLHVHAIVPGGRSRGESVQNAMRALPDDCTVVLVHDGARPLVSQALIHRVIQSAREKGSGVPALPLTDTVKHVDDAGHAIDTMDRRMLRRVQTPQGFRRALLESAYIEGAGPATDDAALVEQLGVPVHLVEGDEDNIKITFPGDLEKAERAALGMRVPRIGHGFDVHRMEAGRSLVLCGVTIPFDKGLLGHSDADVGTHALIDALLGAAALGDIGTHFPDTDYRYKGICSIELLKHTVELLKEHSLIPVNVDITLAAQAPRLRPHIDDMRQTLADAMGLSVHHVSVKATTTEGLSFEGTGEGISARAVCLLQTIY